MHNWLLHGRTYDNQRFSPLKQISPANVRKLAPVAIIQTGVANSFEATPIVVNVVMYISTASDHVQAYDAVSGEPLWSYTPTLSYSDLCCGPQSRGVAVAYGKVFVAQLDGVMVALDARTGKLVWKSDRAGTLPPNTTRYSFTAAPQIYNGLVVIGIGGAEYPIRGFVQAYDAETGKLVWRFYTVAAPGEPGGDTWSGDSWKVGGGSMWNTPAFDPKTGLISFAVGNPNPDIYGEGRKGDNAYYPLHPVKDQPEETDPPTGHSIVNATRSRTCSASLRTGDESIPATTDALTPSSRQSASPQSSSSGSINES